MNALALQCGPQQWVLYAIIGLLEVYKSCKQGLLLRFGPVNEMAQGRRRRKIYSSMAANKADRME